ncbi:GNAT family N-acetyltransferase [soil metagenome]
MTLTSVGWGHPDAAALREAQRAEVGQLYAHESSFTPGMPSEEIDDESVVATFVAYDEDLPIGHIALRRLGDELEIKRMYVAPSSRGSGVANDLLVAVEHAARDASAPRLILHTGNQQHAAIAFYGRHGYTPIAVYPPYEDVTYSLCFEKVLSYDSGRGSGASA